MFNIVKKQLLGHCFLHFKQFCGKSCENGAQVYDSILENAMNKQINRELSTSHEYFSIGQHFLHTKVGQFGFGGFFLHQSLDELKHAQFLCDFQRKRSGTIEISNIPSPNHPKNMSPINAVNYSLELESNNLNCLNTIHAIAAQCNDNHALDVIGGTLIKHQVDEIHQLKILLTKLCQIGTNNDFGLYLIDRELLKKFRKHGDVSH